MNAHDAVTIQRETHRLKGSIGNFASQAAFDAAQRLEVWARKEISPKP